MMQEPRLPERRTGESALAFYARVRRWLIGDDVRVKTDLQDWTGSGPMHLDKSRSED